MSDDHGGGKGRRKGAPADAEHADERWLLTYADMITLLMALFIVMWAISSVLPLIMPWTFAQLPPPRAGPAGNCLRQSRRSDL